MIFLDKTYVASLDSIRAIRTDLESCLGYLTFSDRVRDSFILCASEIFTNALKHADIQPKTFKIVLRKQGKILHFILMDDGSLFENFEMKRHCSVVQSTKIEPCVLETGGIGLFLAGRDFDDFAYRRMQKWNYYHLSTSSPFSEKKPIVLIIDDDPVQRDLLALYISETYTVKHAESGRAAMVWLNEVDEKPALILCDVVMSNSNGVELCMELQKDKNMALIPFIFMTGEPENPVAKIAADLPANDFLEKPVQKYYLLKSLKRTLSKAQQDQRLLGDRLDGEITSVLAPSLPKKIGCYKISLKWQAAEAGGGDIALHFPGNGYDHIIMMDIMGHGAQAKFFSHSFVGYLHGFLSAQRNVQDPGQVLTALSHFLHTDKIGEKTILTAQILMISKDGTFKIASAGHPAPLLCDSEGVRELEIEGAMPGLIPDTVYESIKLSLKPQQRLILYTDGLMEVGGSAEDMETHKNNMIDVIKSVRTIPVCESAEQIWNNFIEKTAGSPNDDALFIILQRD